MRKVISKSTAIKAVVLIFALIGILTVFPARLYSNIWQATGGGEVTSDTLEVHYEQQTVMQEFVSQYERLSSVDIYISNPFSKTLDRALRKSRVFFFFSLTTTSI